MWSSNLGRFIVAIIVMILLMALTSKYVLDDDNNLSWQTVSAKGFNTKVQTGLTQMYWQWQNQGRPTQIAYKPENATQTFVINMTAKGVPKVELSQEGCDEVLSWFNEENVLSNQLKVSTTLIEKKVFKNGLSKKLNAKADLIYICQFSFANKVFQYDLTTGHFTFTD